LVCSHSRTPDYLNFRQSNLLGFKTKTARTGSGAWPSSAVFVKMVLVSWMLYKDTYSEYIECKLNQALETGRSTACVIMWRSTAKVISARIILVRLVTNQKVSTPDSHTSMWGYEPKHTSTPQKIITSRATKGWVNDLRYGSFAKGGERFLRWAAFTTEFPAAGAFG